MNCSIRTAKNDRWRVPPAPKGRNDNAVSFWEMLLRKGEVWVCE